MNVSFYVTLTHEFVPRGRGVHPARAALGGETPRRASTLTAHLAAPEENHERGQPRGGQAFLDPEHRFRLTLGAGTAAQLAPKPPCPWNKVKDARPNPLFTLSSQTSLDFST